MKKHYALLSVMALSVGMAVPSFGQLQHQHSKPAYGNASRFGATTHFTSSPNLHHHADGQPCIADHLTDDWIKSAGIEDRYRSEEAEQAIMARDFEGSGDRATYTVPIIFHIVHNPNNPSENVSQAAIYDLLDAVNEDFSATNPDITAARTGLGFVPANADIEFCLAQRDPSGNQLAELGIERVSTVEDFYDPDTEANKMKGNTSGNTGTPGWNRNDYVNVWVCDITNGAGSGVAGYAYKPTVSTLPPASIDGIVIDYNLGVDPSNRVLTHEIGHYLGLSHTWGSTDGAGCGTNDGLTDTPNTAGPSFDYALSCTGLQQTCPGTNTQYENYMDYANCTVMFTQEQVNLMELVITGSRNSLNSSDGCVPVNPMPPVADFSADLLTIIQGGSVNFTDLSTNYPTAWNWSVTPSAGVTFIGGTSATDQDVTMQFTNTGLYTITLQASNTQGSDSEIKTDYITVITSGGGTTTCDTLKNYSASEEAGMTAYSVTGADGYFPGHLFIPGANDFQLYNVCDSFFVAAPTNVRRLYLPVLQADDMGAASNVTFTVWTNNGATPGPGAVIGTQVVPIANLDAGFWNQVDFTIPVAVNGEFWVGAQLSYPGTGVQDTVIFATTNFSARPPGPGTTWIRGYAPDVFAFYNWQSVTSLFVSDPNSSLVMDVLVSNGPTPNAVVSFPVTETCEGMEVTMNGYGSTNTTGFYWDISDGTNDYYYDEGNLTTNAFTEGNWTITLEVDGSCITDLSPVYNLTVNPPIDDNIVVTNENCVAADGALNVTATGGDGGPYMYSINTGATFEPVGMYSGLVTGDYNWIITDNNNCEASGVVSVGNDNTFNPAISPDITITLGGNTTLMVTGGVSWQWYEGTLDAGTTSSINVSPAVTTTYYCNVTDASGCEAELEVTVTVIDDSGIEQVLGDSFTIFPNPTNGKVAMTFNLYEPRELTFEVVNIIGEKVIAPTRHMVKDQTVEMNLDAVAEGVYFVIIRSENETVTRKIVVRR
jgi:PKD repeat protein